MSQLKPGKHFLFPGREHRHRDVLLRGRPILWVPDFSSPLPPLLALPLLVAVVLSSHTSRPSLLGSAKERSPHIASGRQPGNQLGQAAGQTRGLPGCQRGKILRRRSTLPGENSTLKPHFIKLLPGDKQVQHPAEHAEKWRQVDRLLQPLPSQSHSQQNSAQGPQQMANNLVINKQPHGSSP